MHVLQKSEYGNIAIRCYLKTSQIAVKFEFVWVGNIILKDKEKKIRQSWGLPEVKTTMK